MFARGEVNGEGRAETGDPDRELAAARYLVNPVHQSAAQRIGVRESRSVIARELGESSVRRSERNGIAVEAAAERDAFVHLHQDVAPSGHAAQRRAAADGFAE